MPWVKLDDGFPDHPKVLGLSDSAFRLYVRILCYCARYMTDGNVSGSFVRGFGEDADELWRAGLIIENDGGYEVHDYLAYNPSREVIQRERARSAARVGRYRERNIGSSNGQRNPVTNGGPVPVPVPVQKKKISFTEDFETFWTVYPRKQSKSGAKAKFGRLVEKGVSAAVLVAGAERYRDDPNREPEFTKLPTTWLNNGCWEDDPLPARSNGRRSTTEEWLQEQEALDDG